MLLGKKIGPGPRVRQYQLTNHPTMACLEECLRHVSSAPSGANVNISWINGPDEYTITLTYNHSSAADYRANWKSYRKSRHESELIWEHYTSDITLVHNLITEQLDLGALALENEGILSTKHNYLESAESRHSEFVRAGLRNNLRHFIKGMENTAEEKEQENSNSLSPNYVKTQTNIPAQNPASTIPSAKKLIYTLPRTAQQSDALHSVDSLDLRCGRPLLDKLMVTGSKIFSHSAFLFLLERE